MWTVPLVSSKMLGNHYGILSRVGKCFNLYCPGWIPLSMKQLRHTVPQASYKGQINKHVYNAVSIGPGPQTTSCPKPLELKNKISFVSSRHRDSTIIDFGGRPGLEIHHSATQIQVL